MHVHHLGAAFLSELATTTSDKAAEVLTASGPHAGPVVASGAWGLAIWALVGVYVVLVAILACFGLHRGMLVSTCWRKAKKLKEIERTIVVPEHELPRVTLQLPLFNEATVVQRLIETVAQMDYPRDRLHVQARWRSRSRR